MFPAIARKLNLENFRVTARSAAGTRFYHSVGEGVAVRPGQQAHCPRCQHQERGGLPAQEGTGTA